MLIVGISVQIKGAVIDRVSVHRIALRTIGLHPVTLKHIAVCDGVDRIEFDLSPATIYCVGRGIESITKKRMIVLS